MFRKIAFGTVFVILLAVGSLAVRTSGVLGAAGPTEASAHECCNQCDPMYGTVVAHEVCQGDQACLDWYYLRWHSCWATCEPTGCDPGT